MALELDPLAKRGQSSDIFAKAFGEVPAPSGSDLSKDVGFRDGHVGEVGEG